MTIKTIDLFSGIGGIRLGFERACGDVGVGHSCVFASDINKSACVVYRSRFGNSPNPLCDITKIDPKVIPDFDVLLGGFPCQAFSMAGHKKGFDDLRGTLFFNVATIIDVKRPACVLLENVKGLTHHDEGRTFKRIIEALHDLGYYVAPSPDSETKLGRGNKPKTNKADCFGAILNSKDFGVPQNRPRIYIVAFRDAGAGFSFPKGNDNSKRLKDILLTNPVDERYYLSKAYWDTLLRHRKRHEGKGQGFGYAIKNGDDIASTIMCGGMGKERNLIYDESSRALPEWANTARIRTMTPIEWERLQGFDDLWTEAAPISSRMRLLGNSVTVPVIRAVSREIIK